MWALYWDHIDPFGYWKKALNKGRSEGADSVELECAGRLDYKSSTRTVSEIARLTTAIVQYPQRDQDCEVAIGAKLQYCR